MPRLNYGTLLENIVVFEATRACLCRLGDEDSLAFATAFAMPPLTQCWASSGDIRSSPAFCFSRLQNLAQSQPDTLTLQGLWSLCLTNRPSVPVCSYAVPAEGHTTYKRGGPNGPLLAAMLATLRGQTVHLWVNDNGGRYGDSQGNGPTSQSELPKLLNHAGVLVGAQVYRPARHNEGTFPGTIDDLQRWLQQGTVMAAVARVGFLDPDGYMGRGASVSRKSHCLWLRTLAAGCQQVLATTFFGVRSAGHKNVNRNKVLRAFQQDEVGLFPHSLIFQYGSAATGVKVRWLADSINRCMEDLRAAVEATWDGWSLSFPDLTSRQRLKKLTVHIDGQPAD